MKFGVYIEENLVSEWKDFYINYSILKKLLKVLEKRHKLLGIQSIILVKKKNTSEKTLNSSFHSLADTDKESLEERLVVDLPEEEEKELQEKFNEQMILEMKKVDFFFAENLRYYKTRMEKIKVIFKIYLTGSTILHL